MNKLVTTAIIGTGQQPVTDLSTNTGVDTLTQQLTREQPERTLLLAAGAWALYQQAGYTPQSPPLSQSPAPNEDKGPCSSNATHILANLLQSKHDVLLPEALAHLQHAAQRLPHELLPAALTYGSKNKHLQPLLLPVLGTRGPWLAQFSHDWVWAIPPTADFAQQPLPAIETLWQEGTLQQRVETLRHMRTTQPTIALDWLSSTWKKENIEARTRFIPLLEINLSAADEAFLAHVLNDRSENVRKKAIHLLALLPTSAFNQRMRERADTLLHYTGARLHITPPTTLDPTWKHDGIVLEGKHETQLSNLLTQVISHIPPSHWETRFTLTPATLIHAISAAEYAPDGWIEAIVKAWTIAAHRFNLTTWFDPLFAWWSQHSTQAREQYNTLFQHLPQDRAEHIVLSHLFLDVNWIEELLALPHPWSSSFSQTFLETVQQKISILASDQQGYSNYQTATTLMHTIATALPPACFDLALAEWAFPATSEDNNNWYIRFWIDQVNSLKTLLRLRKRIIKEFI